MVIITPAYEFIKHLNILLPTAYLELVLHIYKRWIDSSVSVCYFTKLICIVFIYFSLTEGLLSSRGAPAVRCGEVVRFHHLLV